MSDRGGFPPVVEKTGAGAHVPWEVRLEERLRQTEREREAYAYAYAYVDEMLSYCIRHNVVVEAEWLQVHMRKAFNKARELGVHALPHDSSPPAG